MTALRAGGASDVGQIRAVNQDSMRVGPRIFVVADGMGGHQGGEVASAMAIEAFDGGEQLATVTVNEIVSRVQEANESVFERSAEDPALSGMGTTLVAIALVVAEGEDRLAIVNVGDSRAYRLTGGQLEQVSDDHSLVGDMVREGRITKDQAREHPQKNIVTRAVGIDRQIEVDDFQLLPRKGDRYLLCSDGLTDEVTDDDIAGVLRTVDDPDAAAQSLVDMANEHGGRDNITVLIVDVVDDGDLAAAASAAVPDADTFSHHEASDTATFLAVPDDQAHLQSSTTPAGPSPDSSASPDSGVPTKRQRAVTWRSVLFVAVVVGLVGAGLWLANDYATNTYYVAIDDGEVSIFKGRPGGVLWLDPSLEESTGIDADDVPAEFLDDIEGERTFASLDRARTFVTNVGDRITELEPPPTTTTTTTSTTISTTTTTTTSTP